MSIIIRPETRADHEAIQHVNRLAFGQDEEARLVDALREGGYVRVSLVAERAGRVVGHILFSDLPIITKAGTVPALALAPMAVLPELQRRGIGSALVQKGLEACRQQGHRIVVVLGHTHFYPRFGFSPKLVAHLESPFSGSESFMAVELVPGALDGVVGRVQYRRRSEPGREARTLQHPIIPDQEDRLHVASVGSCRGPAARFFEESDLGPRPGDDPPLTLVPVPTGLGFLRRIR
jgi:putative acetyltransferase